MDNFRNPPPPSAAHSADNNTSISCDSCLRANSSCVGGPRCERCFLHGFECIFSPGEANIVELQNAFASLLLPGQVRPEPVSGTVASAWSDREREEEEALRVRGRRSSGRCAVCRRLRKRCGKEKPKCRGCEDEGFECGYEQELDGEVGEQSKDIDARTAPRCDTCRVWKAHCDTRKPTCSSCEVRGVECRYTQNREGSYGDPSLLKPKALDPNSKSPPKFYPVPTKSWQTPSLPPSVSAYYGTSPPIASPVSRPLGQMYSTPSGCISCFESKEKCLSQLHHFSSGSNPCFRCAARRIECKPFPTGTRLIACDACTKSSKLCTNYKTGLRCDSCDEAGLECSRTSPAQSTVFSNPHARSLPTTAVESPPLRPKRSCDTCEFLQRECDEKSPRCSVCEEVGVSCRYPAWIVPILNSEPPAQKLLDTTCHSCKELDLVCNGALPTCFYCKELGRECNRVVEAAVSPFEIKAKTNTNTKPPMAEKACSTCKAREVRCGAQLPTCQNCKLSGLVCGGYRPAASTDSVEHERIAKDPISKNLELKVDDSAKAKADENVKLTEDGCGTLEGGKDAYIRGLEASKGRAHEGNADAQKVKAKAKDQLEGPAGGESQEQEQEQEQEQDDWETISHTEALGEGKPGEYGVVELD